jgi:hypothetical protein
MAELPRKFPDKSMRAMITLLDESHAARREPSKGTQEAQFVCLTN